MRRFLPLLLACAISAFALPPYAPAHGDDSVPAARAPFQATVTVTSIDVDRDRVEVVDNRGRAYTLDTYQTAITLGDTDSPGHTGDLVPGMRLRVQGTLVSSEIVEASSVRVLPYQVPPQGPSPADEPETGPVTLRGTVESVDSHNHLLVVRVRDHERTIYINSQTDLQDVSASNPAHLDYLPGERVTVEGVFQPDGTILANTISRKLQPGPRTTPAPAASIDTLVGPVVKQSSRYGSRDIKLRTSPNHEVTVHVPRDAQIFRDEHLISVHDLAKNDVVRVRGMPDGDDFKAARIDVLRSND